MRATYELWETSTGNLIGTFEAEQDALDLIHNAIVMHGTDYADTLALGREDDNGRSRTIASGQELAKQALASFAGRDT